MDTESDSSSDHEMEKKFDKFKCDICTNSFASETNLMTHVEFEHEEESSSHFERYHQKINKEHIGTNQILHCCMKCPQILREKTLSEKYTEISCSKSITCRR